MQVKENKNNFFSVLMSCFNDDREYIKIAIESVLNQNYTNFEFIIINDGSNQDTSEFLNSYKNKDYRIKVYNRKNFGLTKSLNYGILKCKYNWIARIDCDDYWNVNKLNIVNRIINKNFNLSLITSSSISIDKQNNLIKKNTSNIDKIKKKIKKLQPVISHSSVIINYKSAINAGLYTERLNYSQDLDLWYKLLRYGNIFYINDPLTYIRIHENQISNLKREEQILNSLIIQLNYLKFQNFEVDVFKDIMLSDYLNLKNKIQIYLNDIGYFKMRINYERTLSNTIKYNYLIRVFLVIISNIKFLILYKLNNKIFIKKLAKKFFLEMIDV